MNKEDRIIGYDVMRIIAAIMVVFIHSNVYFLHNATNQYLVIMLMTAACVVSVPLFFMVSGAGNLVKGNTIEFRALFKRKIPKVFIPFVIWSLVYVVLRIAAGKIDLDLHSILSLLWEPAYYQFWFMYSLLGMYLCIPVFQYIIINADKKLLQYIIAFWVMSSLIIPVFQRYVPGFSLSSHLNLIFLEGYWGYFFLGGYLRKYPLNNHRKYGLVLAIAGVLITFGCAILEWKLTPSDKYFGYVYCAYLLPGAAMMTIGIFLIFQHINISADKKKRWIIYLSGLTMGIFYIHCLLINAFEIIFKDIAPTALNAVIKLVIIMIAAIGICMVLKKIKLFNKYLL